MATLFEVTGVAGDQPKATPEPTVQPQPQIPAVQIPTPRWTVQNSTELLISPKNLTGMTTAARERLFATVQAVSARQLKLQVEAAACDPQLQLATVLLICRVLLCRSAYICDPMAWGQPCDTYLARRKQ